MSRINLAYLRALRGHYEAAQQPQGPKGALYSWQEVDSVLVSDKATTSAIQRLSSSVMELSSSI